MEEQGVLLAELGCSKNPREAEVREAGGGDREWPRLFRSLSGEKGVCRESFFCQVVEEDSYCGPEGRGLRLSIGFKFSQTFYPVLQVLVADF